MKERAFEQTQEDLFRERASVLARAGETVHVALRKLSAIENDIEYRLNVIINSFEGDNYKTEPEINKSLNEINSEILKYNNTREYARLRYYYLIVTREAMGLRRHKMVEEIYKIPPKKECIKGREWSDTTK